MPARLVMGEPLPIPLARCAFSLNLAFGGSNAALLFGRWGRWEGA
jgi:3-oxoacyl-(acyl-carrier-protein) synthase